MSGGVLGKSENCERSAALDVRRSRTTTSGVSDLCETSHQTNGEAGADTAFSADVQAGDVGGVRTQSAYGGVEAILRKGAPQSSASPIPSPSGGGAPLPEPIRDKMEGSFGANFSDVRVHEGPHVSQINAEAYTQGSNIHFAPGRYDTSGNSGQDLLAHELTHVVQQKEGRVQAPPQSEGAPIVNDAGLEREADTMGQLATRDGQTREGASATAPLLPKAIQRKTSGYVDLPPATKKYLSEAMVFVKAGEGKDWPVWYKQLEDKLKNMNKIQDQVDQTLDYDMNLYFSSAKTVLEPGYQCELQPGTNLERMKKIEDALQLLGGIPDTTVVANIEAYADPQKVLGIKHTTKDKKGRPKVVWIYNNKQLSQVRADVVKGWIEEAFAKIKKSPGVGLVAKAEGLNVEDPLGEMHAALSGAGLSKGPVKYTKNQGQARRAHIDITFSALADFDAAISSGNAAGFDFGKDSLNRVFSLLEEPWKKFLVEAMRLNLLMPGHPELQPVVEKGDFTNLILGIVLKNYSSKPPPAAVGLL